MGGGGGGGVKTATTSRRENRTSDGDNRPATNVNPPNSVSGNNICNNTVNNNTGNNFMLKIILQQHFLESLQLQQA